MTQSESQSNSTQKRRDSNKHGAGTETTERKRRSRPLSRRTMVAGIAGLAGIGLLSTPGKADPAPDPDKYGDILDTMQGEGTDEDPYIVRNVRQVQAIAGEPDGHYELGKDINARPTHNWNRDRGEARGFDPIINFTGTLTGNNNTIRRLTINRPDEENIGLVGEADGGTIETLSLEEADILGHRFVGTVIGNGRETTISDVSVTGSVSGDGSVGGIIGRTLGGEIRDSHTTGPVDGDDDNIGGLVGSTDSGGY